MRNFASLFGTLVFATSLVLVGCSPEPSPLEQEDPGVEVDPNEPDPWSSAPDTIGEDAPGRDATSCSAAHGFNNGDRTRLSYSTIAKLAHSAGVPCGYKLVKAVAVAAAESGRYESIWGRNHNCTYDRGLWQINSIWGSYSSFNISTNAHGMAHISKNGANWSPWVTYWKGLWTGYKSSACSAVKVLCGSSGC